MQTYTRIGISDVKTHIPNIGTEELPTITVEFICKFLIGMPYAPECYKQMAEALIMVGLAYGETSRFEAQARELVAIYIEEMNGEKEHE